MAIITKCKYCEKQAVASDGLCSYHHKERKYAEWLDNSDPNNLGIVKWCKELLPEFAFNQTPQFHKDLFLALLNLYNPRYVNKYERLLELISFRGSAKSTAANTLFVAYILANNGRKFKINYKGSIEEFRIEEKLITIVSETGNSAEEFTVRIRDAFSSSPRLRYYYALEIKDAIDAETGQWTRAAFKINDCFAVAVGSGQQVRGKVRGTSRITLLLADDIYSEKNTLTEKTREGTRTWWNNSVINSIDDLKGKVVLLGTILHDDTILIDCERNPQWKTIKVPLMGSVDKNGKVNISKFHRFIEKHLTIDWDKQECKLPYDDIEDKDERSLKQRQYFNAVQKSEDWELAWPDRADLYFIALKYKENVYNGTVSGFYQEYFHITRSPQDRRFKKDFFQHIKGYELEYKAGYNWLRLNDSGPWHPTVVEFGVDLSGTGSDDAVVTIVATLPDYRVIILHQVIGKFSIRDDVFNESGEDLRRNKVVMNRSALKKIGIVDECFRLSRRYRPNKIKVGIAAEEEQVLNEMRRVFEENRDYLTQIIGRKQTVREGKKEVRILNTMLPLYETRMVYHAPHLQKLEYQLEYLGSSDKDDCADSAEVAFFAVEWPPNISLEALEFVPSAIDPTVAHLYSPISLYSKSNNDWRTLF